jgi:PilZ domain-containing protein
MSPSDESRVKEAGQKVIARALKERRRFRRVNVTVTGRLYIPATQEEAICTVKDISPGDAQLLCELKQEPKGRAVIYLDQLGRFEGPIVRAKNGGFVMTFSCSLQKREKLADLLTLEMNRHMLSEADLRRYDRVEAAAGSFTHFTRSTGEQIRCEVLDLSLTGVSVRTELRPPVGEHILIGHRAGRVARHHADGIGIEFLGLSPNSELIQETPPSPVAVRSAAARAATTFRPSVPGAAIAAMARR